MSHKRRRLHHTPQTTTSTTQEQSPMSFETETQDNAAQTSNANAEPSNEKRTPNPNGRKVLLLRARQAALDVVLDGCSVIRAQARLMECVDQNDWAEVFKLTKEEVQRQRDELLQNATLADALRMAEDTGEDILTFAERTGTSFEDIAEVFDRSRNNAVNL